MAVRVIDTDVWSYLYKGRDEAKLYEPHLFGNLLVISFQTQAELFRGAIAAGWGARRRDHLESRLRDTSSSRRQTPCLCIGQRQWIARGVTGDRLPQQTPGLPRPLYTLACLSSRIIRIISSVLMA
jgi:hypothetical protein